MSPKKNAARRSLAGNRQRQKKSRAKNKPTTTVAERRSSDVDTPRRKKVDAKPSKRKTAADTPSTVRETSKLARVIALLRRKGGASIAEISKATVWQSHSVRGAISGAIKKKLGLTVSSDKSEGVRTYLIAG